MSRIIAGRAKGLRLATPSGDRTRPTTDRVREAFFSALATWNGSGDLGAEEHLAGVAFVDLFAGSGAVGLEAASRGASPVVLVEHEQATSRLAKGNADKARLSVEAVTATADSWLARPGRSYDVIWLDPPYGLTNEQVSHTLELALERLVHNGIIVLERSGRDAEPAFPAGTEHWSRSYGETTLYWCQRTDEGADQAENQTDDQTQEDQ